LEDLQPALASALADGCDEGPSDRLALLARGIAGAGLHSPEGADTMADTAGLEQHLRAGRLTEALAIGRLALGDRQPARLMTFYGQVVLPMVRRLEADWQAERIAFEDLGMVFFQLYRLLGQLADTGTDGGTGADPSGRSGTAAPGGILVATVPGEGHVFGAQIVADLLRAQGYRVALRLETDAETLIRAVAGRPLAGLCLSVGHDAALDGLADLIDDLRAAAAAPRMPVIVGGPALVEPAGQYHFLGADAVALTVHEALKFLPGPDDPGALTIRTTRTPPMTRN